MVKRNFVTHSAFKKIAAAAMLSFSLAGCFRPAAVVSTETLSYREIRSALADTIFSIGTFSASGTISVESPTIAQSIGFELSSRRLDSIRILLEGPFGITVGAGLFSRTEYTVYNAMNNSVYQGNSAKPAAGFPVINKIPVNVLLSALNGVQEIPSSAEPDSFQVSGNVYRFVFLNNKTMKEVYEVDRASRRVLLYSRYNEEGSPVWKLRYRYTKNDLAQWVPEETAVTIPSQKITLTIEYTGARYNGTVPGYALDIPDDAKTITIE
ncbi:MAG: DUF4292 domain-containing protein [Bacteroidetes bacterium]|nr:DUF4292 domain-containing protein [Bacteroidota bacterium]